MLLFWNKTPALALERKSKGTTSYEGKSRKVSK
jgi:hypothetical protein